MAVNLLSIIHGMSTSDMNLLFAFAYRYVALAKIIAGVSGIGKPALPIFRGNQPVEIFTEEVASSLDEGGERRDSWRGRAMLPRHSDMLVLGDDPL